MYIGLGLTTMLCILVWLIQSDTYMLGFFSPIVSYITIPTYFLVLLQGYLSITGTVFKKILKNILMFIAVSIVTIIIQIWLNIYTMATIDEFEMPDGSYVRLAQDPVLTNFVYSLWQADGSPMFSWHKLSIGFTYSESGEFRENPHLVLSDDKKYLLISRGGIFTDCVEVKSMDICEGTYGHPYWGDRQEWLDRSDKIAILSGVIPS
jgi:hypothetical protein